MLWYICYSLCKVWSVWLLNSWGSYKETILKGRAAKFKSGSALSCGICHFDNTSLFKLLMSIFCAKFLRYSMFLFLIFGLFWLWESRHHKVWVNVKALSLSLSPSVHLSGCISVFICTLDQSLLSPHLMSSLISGCHGSEKSVFWMRILSLTSWGTFKNVVKLILGLGRTVKVSAS